MIAVIAPLVGAVVIGLLTGSPFVLVFALLSPLIAIATTLDGRRTARRDRRDEAERFERECRAYAAAVAQAHALERAELEARHPVLGVGLDARHPLRLGSGPAPSAAAPHELLLPGDSADEVRLRAVLADARQNPRLPVLVPRGRVAVRGEGLVTEALVRRLEHEPGTSVVRLGEGEHPAPGALFLHVRSATRIDIVASDGATTTAQPEFVGRRQLAAAAAQSARGRAVPPPTVVRWADLAGAHRHDAREASSTAVAIGLDGAGLVSIDLERDGPHALVGGTTGSGKSEFLRTLALGWAAERSPGEVQLLFVDFKGGATFAGLTDLPHAVGIVTDLDPLVAERALLSLRAELRRRERVLAEAGLRDVAQQPGLLSRLVVLVDEFAALLDAFPELHAAFADLSARGRSLGVHLVLCTQNPAAVVRDSVAANCSVRIAFRLTASASAGFVGAGAVTGGIAADGSTVTASEPAGRALAAAPPGRGLVVTAGTARAVQVATVDDTDIAAVCERWAGAQRESGPWLPPLPARLDLGDVEPHAITASLRRQHGAGPALVGLPPLVFGMLDDPAEQRQVPAVWEPARDGSLAVVGAPRSGTTTALAALADAARRVGAPIAVLPGVVHEAWEALDGLIEAPLDGGLLLADDLGLLLADAGELGPELLARWDAAVRALRRAGGAAAAGLGSATAARSLLGARFESRLILRCVDADDHQLAGAPRGLVDRSAPPGRGWWSDRQVQVLAAEPTDLEPMRCPALPWQVPQGRDVVVVTRRPARVASALRAATASPVVTDLTAASPAAEAGSAVVLAPRILVGDPEGWHAAWSLFTALRRTSPIVIAQADAADLRALLGLRTVPPPLGAGEVWVTEPSEPLRRRSWAMLAAG